MEVIFAVGNIDKPIIKIKAGVKTCSFFVCNSVLPPSDEGGVCVSRRRER